MERNTNEALPLHVVQTGQEEERQPWFTPFDLAMFTAGFLTGTIIANVIWLMVH